MTVAVLNALLWLRDFLNALKEIAKHPQIQAQREKSTINAEKPKELFTQFWNSRQISCQFASLTLSFCLSFLSSDPTASWEMPTGLWLEERRAAWETPILILI